MLMRLWKDYKKLLIIIHIICFIFLFKINSVSAYVYKSDKWSPAGNETFTGTLSNGNSNNYNKTFQNAIAINNSTPDIIVFKYGIFDLQLREEIYGAYCLSWLPNSVNENSSAYECGSYIGNEGHSFDLSGKVLITAALFYDNNSNSKSTCIFSSELQDMIICPIDHNKGSITSYEFNIRNGGYNSITYNIVINGLKYYYNYDSSEIVNGLLGVQQAQNTTATYIQNFNNYVSNTDTTSSQTNSTTALSGLAQDFNTNLGEMNQLTQFVFLPINFIISMLDSTCQPLIWDIPFVNTRVVVPCLSTIYNGYFASFMGVFGIVMTSLLTYRSCIKLFGAIKGLLDAEDDKIEVVDL